MLCVDKEKRITLSEISLHCWITDRGKFNLVQEPEVRFTEKQELDIASVLKEKLELKNHTPSTILEYVKSKQGRFGKTAGCFNIMRESYKENTKKKDELVAVTNREVLDNKLLEEIENNDTRKTIQNPIKEPNFSDTKQGQMAKGALPKQVALYSENYTKVRSMDETMKTNNCVDFNLTKEHSSQAWRRSVMPSYKRGEMPPKLSRLKRVDNSQQIEKKQPLQDRDMNIVNNCNRGNHSQTNKMNVNTRRPQSASKNFQSKKYDKDLGRLAVRLR